MTAIKELGYQPLKHDIWSGERDDVPSGCNVKILNPNQVIHPHLIDSSGMGRGHPDFIPICRGPENTGNLKYAPGVQL